MTQLPEWVADGSTGKIIVNDDDPPWIRAAKAEMNEVLDGYEEWCAAQGDAPQFLIDESWAGWLHFNAGEIAKKYSKHAPKNALEALIDKACTED